MNSIPLDWLDADSPTLATREEAGVQALNFARLHQIFVTDPAAKKLLEHWKLLANVRVPVNATVDQYARAEAVRSFVQTIEDQIKFATHDGRVGSSK